jgi:hypothetical protein
MARNLFWLFLLTWSSYGYTWYCTYTPDTNGYMVEDSLECYDIEESVAISQYWCVNYMPEDPICGNYTTCTDQTEQRSISCTDPNTSGIVNQARFYTCASDSWTPWQTTSESCIPNPPTCIESVEERTVECEPGYHGSSVEQKLTTCSTPYSEPIHSAWTMISTSCTLKAADPTSIESPLNPVSPINSLDQNSVDVTVQSVETVPMDQNPVEQENAIPTTEVEVKTEEKQESTQEPQSPETKDNEEVVPGFGVVLMLNTLETLNNIYEQPVDDFIGLYQDDYAQDQNILFNFIQSDDIGNHFNSIANHRWDQLHGDHPLQRYGFGN